MNFCKDCQSCSRATNHASEIDALRFARCLRIPNDDLPILGRIHEAHVYCSAARAKGGECGPEGKLFGRATAEAAAA